MKTTRFFLLLAMMFAGVMQMSAQNNIKGDMAIYELQGNVKSCKWTNDLTRFLPYDKMDKTGVSSVYGFDQRGRFIKIDNRSAVSMGGASQYMEANRDAKGRMIQATLNSASRYLPGYGTNEWKYQADGKVSSYIYEEDGVKVVTSYVYNSKGQTQKATLKYTFDPETFEDMDYKDHTITISYTYTATDAKGNWTKRTAKASDGKSWTETRVIAYYK